MRILEIVWLGVVIELISSNWKVIATCADWYITDIFFSFKCVINDFVCLFVALRPKSTVKVIAGRSVHLTTLFFLGKLEQAVNQYFVHILSLITDNNPS